MKTSHRVAVILLLVVIGLVGAAYVQGMFGGDNRPSVQVQEVVPANPVQVPYENGKVIVVVGVNNPSRNYAYRTGDIIPVRILIASDPGVEIDTNSIVHNLVQDGSGIEFAGQPTYAHLVQAGKNITIIDCRLRFWVIKPTVAFQTSFVYATSLLPDGKPNWTPAATPPFVVSTSATANDNSSDLMDGDLNQQTSPHPTPVAPMRALGLLLLLLPLGFAGRSLYRRLYPPKVRPANELAWEAFDGVLSSHSADGVSYEKAQQVAHTLRQYLNIESTPRLQVVEALESFYAKDDKRLELARVAKEALDILDAALYQRPADEQTVALNRSQVRELFARIARLVPRP